MTTSRPRKPTKFPVAVITGSRSEFGLLDPVITQLMHQPWCDVQVIVAGEHLIGDQPTQAEVATRFPIHAQVAMHSTLGIPDRAEYARAVARGIDGFTTAFSSLKSQLVVVLGDRIEAFAAAIAANLLGLRLCHIHAGDVAEGIADEAMRHAISRLAHAHACATKQAAQRMIASGESRNLVRVTGSPAIDALAAIPPINDALYLSLGSPQGLILLHPSGIDPRKELATAKAITAACHSSFGPRVLCLQPNFDPGRDIIADELRAASQKHGWQYWPHLPRPIFIGLLKKLQSPANSGLLLGNSSAGIIEAGAIGLRAINVGPRQAGRERGSHVIDVPLQPPRSTKAAVLAAITSARSPRSGSRRPAPDKHPYGDGHASSKIATLIEKLAQSGPDVIRKRLTI